MKEEEERKEKEDKEKEKHLMTDYCIGIEIIAFNWLFVQNDIFQASNEALANPTSPLGFIGFSSEHIIFTPHESHPECE